MSASTRVRAFLLGLAIASLTTASCVPTTSRRRSARAAEVGGASFNGAWTQNHAETSVVEGRDKTSTSAGDFAFTNLFGVFRSIPFGEYFEVSGQIGLGLSGTAKVCSCADPYARAFFALELSADVTLFGGLISEFSAPVSLELVPPWITLNVAPILAKSAIDGALFQDWFSYGVQAGLEFWWDSGSVQPDFSVYQRQYIYRADPPETTVETVFVVGITFAGSGLKREEIERLESARKPPSK